MSHNLYTINNDGADVASFHGANLGVVYIGRGESSAYTASLNIGDFFEFYDTNPVNTLGATLTQGASAGWIKSVGLAAGTYEVNVSALVTGTGSSTHTALNCFTSAGSIISLAFQCRDPILQNGWRSPVPTSGHGMFTLSTSDTIRWTIGGTRTNSDIGGRMSENSFLFIRRLA